MRTFHNNLLQQPSHGKLKDSFSQKKLPATQADRGRHSMYSILYIQLVCPLMPVRVELEQICVQYN